MIQPHSRKWYDRLSRQQDGYYYPWRSTVAPLNGEDEYLQRLAALVAPHKVVLDVGCGHGDVPIRFASACRWMAAYDSTPAFLQLARQNAAERQLTNITFVLAGSLPELLASPDLPPDHRRFDLIISRRGPLNWVEQVRLVAKPGAILFMLNPQECALPIWNERLPEALRLANPRTTSRRESVERRLALAGLALHSAWSFEVPELFDAPRELYTRLSWGRAPEEVPPYIEVASLLEEIFAAHAGRDGLAVPHGRFMWQAVVD